MVYNLGDGGIRKAVLCVILESLGFFASSHTKFLRQYTKYSLADILVLRSGKSSKHSADWNPWIFGDLSEDSTPFLK